MQKCFENNPKVALKQEFKVVPNRNWQARHKLTTRRHSNLVWQSIAIWRSFCVIFGLISARIAGAGAHLLGCVSRRFASPPRTSLILAENLHCLQPPHTHTHTHLRSGSIWVRLLYYHWTRAPSIMPSDQWRRRWVIYKARACLILTPNVTFPQL